MKDQEKFECAYCGCYFWVDDRDTFECPNCSNPHPDGCTCPDCCEEGGYVWVDGEYVDIEDED